MFSNWEIFQFHQITFLTSTFYCHNELCSVVAYQDSEVDRGDNQDDIMLTVKK